MNCKKHNELNDQLDIDTIDLLNNHPSIKGNNYLTDRIMEAALQSEPGRITTKRKNYSFEMKLASSLICTGVFILVSNLLALNTNIFFADGFQKTIYNFNDILTNVINRFQVFY
ncbi:hypothetical protein AN1V17_38920 [Vallitalea sediminicola]